MGDDDWEKLRDRSILAAFQTGRPVFGDTESGVLRYADGDCEPLPNDVGVPKAEVATAREAPSQPSWWERLWRCVRGRA
jgi:hypothetical protein